MAHSSDSGAHDQEPSRHSRYRILTGILLVVLGAATLTTVSLRLAQGDWLNGCAIGAPLGWTLPISTVLVAGGVWWLLTTKGREHGRHVHEDDVEVTCRSCGRTVLRDWRLCPYCAEPLEDVPPLEGARPHST